MNDPQPHSSWIRVPLRAAGEEMDAFLATPSAPPRGSVVMLQEIFGVNDAMREKARDFTSAGFVVLVPDLFWRQGRRIALGYGDADRKQGFGLMQQYDQAAGAADVQDAVAWLCGRDHRKASVVGFCLGGRMAVLAAAGDANVNAVIAFYGVRLDLCVEQLRALSAPFQLHVGDRDAHVPGEHVSAVQAAVAGKLDTEVLVYPGAQHGFYNRLRDEVYNPKAAALARSRALALLAKVNA